MLNCIKEISNIKSNSNNQGLSVKDMLQIVNLKLTEEVEYYCAIEDFRAFPDGSYAEMGSIVKNI
eukprot:UN02195